MLSPDRVRHTQVKRPSNPDADVIIQFMFENTEQLSLFIDPGTAARLGRQLIDENTQSIRKS
jgi:hypothetical protein